MGFDVARVRGLYPTVGAGTAYLEGSFAALQPESVIRAVITALRSAPAQPGSISPRSRRSAASFAAAQQAVADLIGGRPEDVIVGGSASTLAQHVVWHLARRWQLSDEVVLSRLDHDAVVRPVEAAAKNIGASVRWAEVDVETGELPSWQYRDLISKRTRFVSVPLANPVTGAVPDVAAITARAHAVGATVLVDAGAGIVHRPIDLDTLGADLLLASAASFGGPTMGFLGARAGVLGRRQATGGVQQAIVPGSLPVELLDGLVAAVDHLSVLDDAPGTATRRAQVLASVEQAAAHQAALGDRLRDGLSGIEDVTLLGRPDDGIPALALSVGRVSPERVATYLARQGIAVWTGSGGYSELMRTLGTDELGGVVFVGVMPHTTRGEIDRVVAALTELPR